MRFLLFILMVLSGISASAFECDYKYFSEGRHVNALIKKVNASGQSFIRMEETQSSTEIFTFGIIKETRMNGALIFEAVGFLEGIKIPMTLEIRGSAGTMNLAGDVSVLFCR